MDLIIEKSWKKKLFNEFNKPYFHALSSFLNLEYKNLQIFPDKSLIFNAFNLCSFDNVKVVILGQDPYHNKNQADGLSFSVPVGEKIPPSLRNIFKEIQNDLGVISPKSGNLQIWAEQGVLLLNSILTVQNGKPASHQFKGWEIFTDKVIELLSNDKKNLVFMLWGNYARDKGLKINRKNHLLIESSHPSPFSAKKSFLGSKQFSRCNNYLELHKKGVINW
ncbi:MAG: uracil-DNA glycosylase [Flavobacteriales bacterium]|nr:uracil-DNA glycosylase [Flavobacteriales bacterium]|tara:strand:+ start:20032 stop:20694 length:663 start_codon:yes stop_codon:yes gene_type:complete